MISDPTIFSLPLSIGAFILAAGMIGFFGQWLTSLADQLADRTGLGEALTGALFLGASTSLPEIATSVTAAAKGYSQLAVSNALGGIAVQTAFLSIADMTYRRANLEHAAASIANIMQGTLAVVLLAICILASVVPDPQWLGIHPATPLMLGVYLYGLHLVYKAQTDPMWKPQRTSETRDDIPEDNQSDNVPLVGLWVRFVFAAVMIGSGGWLIAESGIAISKHTRLSETIIGTVFTSVSTSLPELVITLAAVRQGALTLAVGGILGGNAFDTLLMAFSDVAYRAGTIYQGISQYQVFLMALTILMTGILLMGLVRREKHGIANIGFESFFILVLYIGMIAFLFMS